MNLADKYGKWAIVTGASSGIGKEFALYLANEKMNLILISRRSKDELAKQLIEKFGIEVITLDIDLSKPENMSVVQKEIENRDIGILINNAGFGKAGDFTNHDIRTYTEMINLNCLAPVYLTDIALEIMLNKKRGAVIFLGSLVAYQPTPYMSVYSATKSFDLTLGLALYGEYKKKGIDILVVNPGPTKTEFHKVAGSDGGFFQREAADVVKTAMKSLGKKPAVLDGIINKILVCAGRFIPVKLSLAITEKIARSIYVKN
ncbi:short-chain dehydrogenase/reductase SDR [Melioribacter roseus P3M-2]|uniref:Short-chain dehydrogenase/reductase SDR n=1 Tax=Melioribacter roseus (strain DSM 23840 / JCM 17771 / VKM B-2668 / P3M-2) TaxID=1191523 RepID=I6YYP8_MELRP|nr:SDR family oxidoreductase [Melioribacter roseus]AFN75707.1 short-chain dehydrogenase/reductase SDR [Melioribacter roseus P3M-2]